MSQQIGGGRSKTVAIVKNMDMVEELQTQAIEKAQEALNKFETERDIAQYIKKAFDESNGLTWHCIVGKSFGSFVTHDRFVSYGELWHKIK